MAVNDERKNGDYVGVGCRLDRARAPTVPRSSRVNRPLSQFIRYIVFGRLMSDNYLLKVVWVK